MTKSKAVKILQINGFEVEPEVQRYEAMTIRHRMTDSLILGRIYSDSILLQSNIEKSDPARFNLGPGSSPKRFGQAVAALAEEVKRYDEILRKSRVENVKQYFRDKETL